MIKKFCPNCRTTAWHNRMAPPQKGREQDYRCTNCGVPVPNHNMNEGLKQLKLAFAKRKNV